MIDATKAADFLRRVQIGVDYGRKKPTMEHLWGSYYVFHKPGNGYQSGREWRYGCASHELLDLTLDDGKTGIRTYDKCRVNVDYYKEGRFLKADRAAWLADIREFMP